MKKKHTKIEIINTTQNPQDTFDPLGSYTGMPADPRDKPQQDADDL